MATVTGEQRLGNGFVRMFFSDGTHHDVSEDRYSEMELRLIEAASFRDADGPSKDATGAAAAFVTRYGGQRYDGRTG